MEDFDSLMKQAVSIKTGQMLEKRRKFEALPLFIKAGLYYLVKFANVRKQGFYQRYATSDHLKARGNRLFKEEKAEQAAREYEQALSIFRHIVNNNPNWKSEGIMDQDLEYIEEAGADEEEQSMIQAMKVALYNNLAACYLSLNDLANARAACDEALLLDPSQAKALYRRAKAWISDINSGTDEYKLAIEDLKKAMELSPNDSAIYQTLVKAKQDLVKVKASSKSFQGMFSKPSKNDETTEKETKDETPKNQSETEKKEEVQPKPEETVTIQPITKAENKIEEPKKEEEKVTVQPEKKVEDIKKKERERLIEEEKKHQEKKVLEQKNKSPKEENKTEKVKKEKGALRLYEDKDEEDKNKENKIAAPEKPDEIKELEQFLAKRGSELLRFYESTGNTKMANELKEHLKQAMIAKQRIERISGLDFEKPNAQQKEEAERFGLDLSDPLIKEELLRIQKKHLQDLKKWLMGVGPGGQQQDGTKPIKKKTKTKDVTAGEKDITSKKEEESGVSKRNVGQAPEEDRKEDVDEVITEVSEKEKNSKSAKLLNYVIITAAIVFFLITLYNMQKNRTPNIPNRISSFSSNGR